MLRSRRRIMFIVLALIVLACSVYALSFKEQAPPDFRGKPAQQGQTAQIVAGPYIQNVTANAVTIMWQTDIPTTGEVTVTANGHSSTFATKAARRLSQVRVAGLAADTVYGYTVNAGGAKSRHYAFRTFPTGDRTIRFIVYGDTRSHPDRHQQVAEAMAAEKNIDFVLHSGDVVSDGRDLASWIPTYFGPAADLIARVPVYTAPGNHERNSPYYYAYFDLPGNEQWYSFDAGDVHVISLDSNTAFDPGSKQYGWLISDLQANKDKQWKFVMLHHPTFTSGSHGGVNGGGIPNEKGIRDGQALFPRLAAMYGITAFFAGHDHAYERSVKDGVSYIVSGGGGAPSYGEPNAAHNPYRRVFYSGIHYCVVTVSATKAEMIVKTPDGKVLDKAQL